MQLNTLSMVHEFLRRTVKPGDFCIDATAQDPCAAWYGVEFEKALPLLCDTARALPEN